MDRKEIADKVQWMLAEQLNIPAAQAEPNARLMEDLGADSLDLVELVMRAEDKFGIEIPDEEAEQIRTVIQAVDAIQAKLEQR